MAGAKQKLPSLSELVPHRARVGQRLEGARKVVDSGEIHTIYFRKHAEEVRKVIHCFEMQECNRSIEAVAVTPYVPDIRVLSFDLV